jgi:NADH-quinone oxidoreductase subunit M
MPIYATLFLFMTLSSVGLPLLNGFVGEFLVLSGAFGTSAWYGLFATTGVIWSAGYLLWLYQRTFYGTIKNPVNERLPDANTREQLCLIPLCVLALIMGVASPLWMRQIDPSVTAAIAGVSKTSAKTIYKSTGQSAELHTDSTKR